MTQPMCSYYKMTNNDNCLCILLLLQVQVQVQVQVVQYLIEERYAIYDHQRYDLI
jgi:hypothetical protein